MTADQMKRIVLCFERWLEYELHPLLRAFIRTPEATDVLSPHVPPLLEKSMASAMRDIDVAKEIMSWPDSPEVRSHTVRHAEPAQVPAPTAKPAEQAASVGFASLLKGAKATPEPTPTPWHGSVGEFQAMVSGTYRNVRYLSKAGGVIRVQVLRDDGNTSLTILTSVEQVHPDDHDRVSHLFGAAS